MTAGPIYGAYAGSTDTSATLYAVGGTGAALSLTTSSWDGGSTAQPIKGSLLLMTMTTTHVSSPTYFGDTKGVAGGTGTSLGTFTGWSPFGATQQGSAANVQTNHCVSQWWSIATGTSTDTPSTVGGYTALGGSTVQGGVVAVQITELRANVQTVDGVLQCVGNWDTTNAFGLGCGLTVYGLASTYSGAGSTLTLNGNSSWSTNFTYAAIWNVCHLSTAAENLTSFTQVDSTYPIADNTYAAYVMCGISSNGVSSASNVTPDLTLSGTTPRDIVQYAIGFTPTFLSPPLLTTVMRGVPLVGYGVVSVSPQVGVIGTTPSVSINAAKTATISAAADVQVSVPRTISSAANVQVPNRNTVSSTADVLAHPPLILMGSGNSIEEALGTSYFELSGNLDGGGPPQPGATSPFLAQFTTTGTLTHNSSSGTSLAVTGTVPALPLGSVLTITDAGHNSQLFTVSTVYSGAVGAQSIPIVSQRVTLNTGSGYSVGYGSGAANLFTYVIDGGQAA